MNPSPLTPLEKEFFLTMFSGKEENRDSEKEMAKAAAYLCERKIKHHKETLEQIRHLMYDRATADEIYSVIDKILTKAGFPYEHED